MEMALSSVAENEQIATAHRLAIILGGKSW
jgi:hypothetical protein